MENNQKTHQAIKRGLFWAPIYLFLFIPFIILPFIASWYPNNLIIKILLFIVYWGNLIIGILLYLGIRALGKERNDKKLVTHIHSLIVLSAAVVALLAGMSLLGIVLIPVQLILMVGLPLLLGFGIVFLLLAKDFKRLESDFGVPATKAAVWHKISGWLSISIILSPLGGLFSLIADYYMWRVLQQAAKRNLE